MNSLKDECKIENGGFIEICNYDYLLGTFVCTCSKRKKFDKTGKVCLPDNDFSNLKMLETSVIDKNQILISFKLRVALPIRPFKFGEMNVLNKLLYLNLQGKRNQIPKLAPSVKLNTILLPN